MTLTRWTEADRETLTLLLPDALTVLPVGAIEQHGPHLATGTDALLTTAGCERAVERAAPSSARPIVLGPALTFGASDHHIPFGGTLSLTPETLLAVLLDLARSVDAAGGRRLVLVNGHGGNVGVCHAAAAAASARYRLAVAQLDYWQLLEGSSDAPVPGHAGAFETAMVLAIRPDLVGRRAEREPPPEGHPAGVHSMTEWQRIQGYTDRPDLAEADQGKRWLAEVVERLSNRLIELARTL